MTDTPRTRAIESPTNELRFIKREGKDDYGLSRTFRLLQQKWRIQEGMQMPTFEWRDVPEVEE